MLISLLNLRHWNRFLHFNFANFKFFLHWHICRILFSLMNEHSEIKMLVKISCFTVSLRKYIFHHFLHFDTRTCDKKKYCFSPAGLLPSCQKTKTKDIWYSMHQLPYKILITHMYLHVSLISIFCFRELTDINILNCFIHLRYVDLSKNNLRDISPINSLTHLLVLKADQNKLTTAQLEDLPYLQVRR